MTTDDASAHAGWTTRISRVSAVKALHAGIDAQDAGLDSSACPFLFTKEGDDPTQPFLAHWWIKGWRRRGVALGRLPGPPRDDG